MTRSSLPFTGTGKKQGTATQTAPNQTAGPLQVIAEHAPKEQTPELMNDRQHIKSIASKYDKIELPSNFPGLARSHRLIMIERSKEIQFMKLCAQIHLDDFKKDRADLQRNERREKRRKA